MLTNPEVLEYVNYDDLVQKVRPNIDGLILKYGNNQGTFLPQVWEQLPNAKFFLEHLSYKAGLEPSVYDRHPEIYRYRVDAIEEKFDAVSIKKEWNNISLKASENWTWIDTGMSFNDDIENLYVWAFKLSSTSYINQINDIIDYIKIYK